jgi:two-component system chemotaxis sensor kinase CheA
MGKRVINLRGTVMPLVSLSDVCGASSSNGQERDPYVVVVKAGERPVAVEVDDLVEQQEIVVKSLGNYTGRSRGIAGASILGDGKVVLILDVATLMKTA